MKHGRPCPVNGCWHDRDPAHVMCRACWFTVPKTLRDDVWRTYRAFGAWADESVEAREAAIAYVERELAEMPAAVAR